MTEDAFSFKGKTAIVTGGNGGIGQGIVRALSERGANIVIADAAPALKPLKAEQILDLRTDITDRGAVDEMVRQTLDTFGRIDVLVNNAGRGKGFARLPELTPEVIDELVQLNIYGTLHCTQAVTRAMITQRSGSIVNISSAAAISGFAGRHDPVYAGCKGFINSLTKALAVDLGEWNIRVNTVAPAWTVPESDDAISEGSFWKLLGDNFGTPEHFNEEFRKTGQLHATADAALAQLGRPSDIANAVVYFASEASRHVTGQLISVCGGAIMPV